MSTDIMEYFSTEVYHQSHQLIYIELSVSRNLDEVMCFSLEMLCLSSEDTTEDQVESLELRVYCFAFLETFKFSIKAALSFFPNVTSCVLVTALHLHIREK